VLQVGIVDDAGGEKDITSNGGEDSTIVWTGPVGQECFSAGRQIRQCICTGKSFRRRRILVRALGVIRKGSLNGGNYHLKAKKKESDSGE